MTFSELACVSLATVALAGCGGGDEGATTTEAREAPSPAQTTAEGGTPAPARTAQARRGVRLSKVGDFEAPVFVTAKPGDAARIYVVEQEGRIIEVNGRNRRTLLDIRDQVTAGGEQGLLSMAWDPEDANRYWVYFTDNDGNQRIVEQPSGRLVLRMDDEEPNHNGGLLLFGPDGLMYVGTGDGGGGGDEHGPRGNAQNLGSLLGKILRINPRASGSRPYTVPRSNPFVARNGARPEIYSYGLRNPWRFSFDRRTGDLSIGDVGQNAWEEISFVRRGRGKSANFGWRPFEGRTRYKAGESAPGHVPPVFVHDRSQDWCSVTGGVVVRDPDLPGLAGRYVFGDFCEGRIWSARLRVPNARDVRRTSLEVPSLSSFGEDARGRVYATSLDGPVYRLVAR